MSQTSSLAIRHTTATGVSTIACGSNTAEGQGGTIREEFHQFLDQARGSLYELETQTLLDANSAICQMISESLCFASPAKSS